MSYKWIFPLELFCHKILLSSVTISINLSWILLCIVSECLERRFLQLTVRVLFSTSSKQAPLCLIGTVNLCSCSSSSLSSLVTPLLYISDTLPFASIWRLFSNWTTNAKHSELHWYDALSLPLVFCLSLTGPEARWRHQQAESMGKQRCLSNQGSYCSFQTIHCLVSWRKSTSLGKIQVSITHPGVCPDEVLMMPNWFVVLEGFPVVFHGCSVAAN